MDLSYLDPASLETWGAQIPRAQHLGLNKPRAETGVHVKGLTGGVSLLEISLPTALRPTSFSSGGLSGAPPPTDVPALPQAPLLLAFHFFPLNCSFTEDDFGVREGP